MFYYRYLISKKKSPNAVHSLCYLIHYTIKSYDIDDMNKTHTHIFQWIQYYRYHTVINVNNKIHSGYQKLGIN